MVKITNNPTNQQLSVVVVVACPPLVHHRKQANNNKKPMLAHRHHEPRRTQRICARIRAMTSLDHLVCCLPVYNLLWYLSVRTDYVQHLIIQYTLRSRKIGLIRDSEPPAWSLRRAIVRRTRSTMLPTACFVLQQRTAQSSRLWPCMHG